jgi:flagellar assembly protein FliH
MPANIIKAKSGTTASLSPRIPKVLADASEQAKETIARARVEAEEIVSSARLEREALITESKEKGYADGLDRWNDILVGAWETRSRYLAANDTVIVQLAMAVARKIIGEVANVDPSTILQSAREAIRSVRGEHKLRVRVRPEDESIMLQQTIELKRSNSEVSEIQVIADESITLGGCIVESPIGTIDAQFSTQLQSLERAILRGTHVENSGA